MSEKNYFKSLVDHVEKLDELANNHLNTLKFIPSPECVDRIWQAAHAIFIKEHQDWNKIPEWVADVMDGGVPFSSPPSNGSLDVILGFSVVSQDAHLRQLLEFVEGRVKSPDLPFPVIAEVDVVNNEVVPVPFS